MKALTTIAAATALIAGMTIANAQVGTPGTGEPGQDQRPDAGSATGPVGNQGSSRTLDAPSGERGTSTSGTGAGGTMAPHPGTMTAPGTPSNSMDRSVGDRDSRGTPKSEPR